MASVAPDDRRSPARPAARGGKFDGRRLLFVLSTERSGSTLFSMLLGANRRIVAPPELHLLAYPTVACWRAEYPAAVDSLRWLLEACGTELRLADFTARFDPQAPEEVYSWVLGDLLSPDRILVDKTPKYARDPETLERLERLEAHYLWLVRHPLGVAASQIELRETRRRKAQSGVLARLKYPLFLARSRLSARAQAREEVAYWGRVNQHIERFLSRVDPLRQRRVNFEPLVRNPRPILEELCAWLGIAFEEAMLEPGANVPSGMNPLVGDPKIRQRRSVDPDVADAWRRHHSPRLLDRATRDLMHRWDVVDRDKHLF